MPKKCLALLLALLIVTVLTGGCQTAAEKPAEPVKEPAGNEPAEPAKDASGIEPAGKDIAKVTTLFEADNGKETELDIEEIVEIELEGNPSTGFDWYIETIDEKVIKSIGDKEYNPKSRLVGAPASVILRLQAVAAGECELKLVYKRQWESVQPEKTWSVKVKVK